MKDWMAVVGIGGVAVLSGWLGQKLSGAPPVVILGLGALIVLAVFLARRMR